MQSTVDKKPTYSATLRKGMLDGFVGLYMKKMSPEQMNCFEKLFMSKYWINTSHNLGNYYDDGALVNKTFELFLLTEKKSKGDLTRMMEEHKKQVAKSVTALLSSLIDDGKLDMRIIDGMFQYIQCIITSSNLHGNKNIVSVEEHLRECSDVLTTLRVTIATSHTSMDKYADKVQLLYTLQNGFDIICNFIENNVLVSEYNNSFRNALYIYGLRDVCLHDGDFINFIIKDVECFIDSVLEIYPSFITENENGEKSLSDLKLLISAIVVDVDDLSSAEYVQLAKHMGFAVQETKTQLEKTQLSYVSASQTVTK